MVRDEDVRKHRMDMPAVGTAYSSDGDGEGTTGEFDGSWDMTVAVKLFTAIGTDELFGRKESTEEQVIDLLQDRLAENVSRGVNLDQVFVFRGYKLLENPCDYL